MTANGFKYQEIPLAWVRNYGKGRFFCCGLGPPAEAWARAGIRQMWIEAVK